MQVDDQPPGGPSEPLSETEHPTLDLEGIRRAAQEGLLVLPGVVLLLVERVEGTEIDAAALRRCYFWLADDMGIEPVCDEYDAAGPGAGVEQDGYPQCANCGHSRAVHEQPLGAPLLSRMETAERSAATMQAAIIRALAGCTLCRTCRAEAHQWLRDALPKETSS